MWRMGRNRSGKKCVGNSYVLNGGYMELKNIRQNKQTSMVFNNVKETEHWEDISGVYHFLLAFSRRCETLLVSLSFILCLLPLASTVCIGTGLYSGILGSGVSG